MSGQVWFTADTHFGHAAMAATGKGWRPFATVEEHDECLIDSWNAVIRPGDQVWHLGDVGMGPEQRVLNTVGQLHGTKHLITGNHDRCWPGDRQAHKHQRAWLEQFETINQYGRRRADGIEFLLSHFPYEGDHTGDDRYTAYRLQDTGLPLVHGHVHGAWAERGRHVNVGVDVREWTPVHLADLVALLRGIEA